MIDQRKDGVEFESAHTGKPFDMIAWIPLFSSDRKSLKRLKESHPSIKGEVAV